jgi:uncharacterized membrane protein YkoI
MTRFAIQQAIALRLLAAMNTRRAAVLMLWLPVAGASTLTTATAVRAAEPTERVRVADGALSMDQAVKLVEQRYHARVVKAETHKDAGRSVYVLRLLDPSGKVWTVHVSAADGTIQ